MEVEYRMTDKVTGRTSHHGNEFPLLFEPFRKTDFVETVLSRRIDTKFFEYTDI